MSYSGWSTSNYIASALNAFSTPQSSPLTIVCWMKRSSTQWADTTNDFAVVFSQDLTTQNDEAAIIAGGGAADQVKIRAHNTWTDGSSQAIKTFSDGTYDDTWVCVIGIVNSTALRTIYIYDSTSPATDTTSGYDATSCDSVIVGWHPANTGSIFTGSIAEIAIFDGALSTGAIDQLQTGSGAGPAPNTVDSSNCIGYWPLDTNQTNHADQSGNGGPTLTVQGSPTFDGGTFPNHPNISSASSGWYGGSTRGVARGVMRGVG